MIEISRLPSELLVKIFSECDLKDQGAIAQVCQLWNDLSEVDEIWRAIAQRKFGISSAGLEGARAICLSKALGWKSVPQWDMFSSLSAYRENVPFLRPQANPPQIACAVTGGVVLFNAQTLDQIAVLQNGERPIGWYREEFFCYRGGDLVGWRPEDGTVRTIPLNSLEKGGAVQLDSFGDGRIVNVLHVGVWKGRPSCFFDLWPTMGGNLAGGRFCGVCSLQGDRVERLCELPTYGTSKVSIRATSSDGLYFACGMYGLDSELRCFHTASGNSWTCEISKRDSFAFIGDLLVIGGSKLSVYSAANGQPNTLGPDFPEKCHQSFQVTPSKQEDDKTLLTLCKWEVQSIATPAGTFLFALQKNLRTVMSDDSDQNFQSRHQLKLVLQGFYCRAGEKEAIALKPLTIDGEVSDGGYREWPCTVQWALLPSGDSCRVMFEAPDDPSFSRCDYEFSEAWLNVFAPTTSPRRNEQQSSNRSWSLTVAARVLSTVTKLL